MIISNLFQIKVEPFKMKSHYVIKDKKTSSHIHIIFRQTLQINIFQLTN